MNKLNESVMLILAITALLFSNSLVYAVSMPEKENIAKSSQSENVKGAIKGKVYNKTLKAAPVSDHEIKLTMHSQDISGGGTDPHVKESPPTVVTLISKSDKDGNFIFQDLEINEKTSYILSTEYSGIKYFGGIIQLKNAQPGVLTELVIYETTEDEPPIQVNREHLIANMAEDSIFITDVIIIENKGDKTYLGSQDVTTGKKKTLLVTLPKGHDQVQYFRGLSDESTIKDEKRIIFTEPFKPGNLQLVFGYRLLGKQNAYEWTKTFDYDTASIDLLFLDSGIKIQSDKLQLREPVRLDDKNYLRLTGTNIKKGETAKISISLPKSSYSQGSFRLLLIATVIVLIAAIFSYSLLRRRKEVPNLDPEASKRIIVSTQKNDLEAERNELIMAIADLDDQLYGQKISQQEYQKNRDKKKERLIEITKLLGKA